MYGTKAHDTVMRILDELSSRKGFDGWWDDIDGEVQVEIINALVEIVEVPDAK